MNRQVSRRRRVVDAGVQSPGCPSPTGLSGTAAQARVKDGKAAERSEGILDARRAPCPDHWARAPDRASDKSPSADRTRKSSGSTHDFRRGPGIPIESAACSTRSWQAIQSSNWHDRALPIGSSDARTRTERGRGDMWSRTRERGKRSTASSDSTRWPRSSRLAVGGGRSTCRGPMGFELPRRCVQGKSSDASEDVKALRELQGVMKQLGAGHGLLVAWGGIKRTVDREALCQFFEIRAWDPNDVIDALFEHSEGLPEELPAELLLKPVWTLVPNEADRRLVSAQLPEQLDLERSNVRVAVVALHAREARLVRGADGDALENCRLRRPLCDHVEAESLSRGRAR